MYNILNMENSSSSCSANSSNEAELDRNSSCSSCGISRKPISRWREFLLIFLAASSVTFIILRGVTRSANSSISTDNSNSLIDRYSNSYSSSHSDSNSNSNSNSYDNSNELIRRLMHSPGKVAIGNSEMVPNITVYGSMIWSEVHPGHATNAEIVAARQRNAYHLFTQLPFSVVQWPAVFTKPCPQYLHGHKTERGLALAHYQIWLDFTFFDHDVLEARERNPPEYIRSTPYSSISGSYEAFNNGSLYKNGVEFREEDIMIIFEDDVVSAINELNTTLIEELNDMKTDLLFLGWCDGRLARPVPLCAHAYAITRRGARKLIKYFEPCGKALDEQFVVIAKNNWITFRTAHAWSYGNNILLPEYQNKRDATRGIFRQKKGNLGSINGH